MPPGPNDMARQHFCIAHRLRSSSYGFIARFIDSLIMQVGQIWEETTSNMLNTCIHTPLVFKGSDHDEMLSNPLTMLPRWKTFKWQHQGVVVTEPVKIGHGWGEDAPCDQRLHGYRFDCSMLPRRGACLQRQKKGEIASERLSQQQIYLILRPRHGSRDKQKLKGESLNTKGGGNLDRKSRLINEKAVRWNEQEIQEEAMADSFSLILCSSKT